MARDLGLGPGRETVRGLCLVAPDAREGEVRAQLARPAFRNVEALNARYHPDGQLARNRDAVARFGEGLKAIEAVSRLLCSKG